MGAEAWAVIVGVAVVTTPASSFASLQAPETGLLLASPEKKARQR